MISAKAASDKVADAGCCPVLKDVMRKYISPIALYYISIAFLLLLFLQAWRLVLLVSLYDRASQVPAPVLMKSFLVGLRFDFAIAGYVMLPLVVVGLLFGRNILQNRWARRAHVSYLLLAAAVVFFAHMVDIEFFRYFNVRLNGTAGLWNEHPNIILPMIWESYPVIRYLLMYVLSVITFAYAAWRLLRWFRAHFTSFRLAAHIVWTVVLIALIGVGIRGRLEEKSPLRWGMAYFSEFPFANQLALNPMFTFAHDAIYMAGRLSHVQDVMNTIADPEAESITRRLLGHQDTVSNQTGQRLHRHVSFPTSDTSRPNVLVVIMESFGASGIGALGNRWNADMSPRFDSLSNRGILFSNVYSSGAHTYTGLFSTLYGYPAGFGNLVMKRQVGNQRYWGLPQILQEYGYHTFFFTTSDPHFDNMQGFLKANGVETIVSLFDYPPAEKLSSMGVPDHVMFDRAIELLGSPSSHPFFAALLTGSNHGPWIIPDAPFDKVPETVKNARPLNAFRYSDWALGRFVRMLESDARFENTLVVVTADNGLLHQPVSDMDLTQYHIPLLLYWIGNTRPASARIDRLGSQMDIVATVMGQVQLDYDDYTFGKDLLDSARSAPDFAFFSEWYKIGYIQDQYYAITRLDGPASLYGLSNPTADIGNSLPRILTAFSRKAMALYQTAFYNSQRPLNPPEEIATN